MCVLIRRGRADNGFARILIAIIPRTRITGTTPAMRIGGEDCFYLLVNNGSLVNVIGYGSEYIYTSAYAVCVCILRSLSDVCPRRLLSYRLEGKL